ncbi:MULTISPECIES: efflux RND transporter periplasmic adaptor subunit [Hydrocarboniphaga]|nr:MULTISPECIES: efflux RND transporter periplasmic adaptor subunit [Hydrocarboniphaga]MDZ4076803.1 efflux RND transporter periplasmic adaptor subunit [Hydrocarboniphaga sp.]
MSPTHKLTTDNATPSAMRSLRTAGIVASVAAIGIVTIGVMQRARSSNELREWTEANAVPSVVVAEPKALGIGNGLQLPGRLEAFSNAPIYARADGYLKTWYADIGTEVKAGDLLALIETPDLDQQLAQARANLLRVEADARLAETTAKRWQAMLGTEAVSTQEVDEKAGDYAAKKAAVIAARAAVDTLAATQGFRRIVAPFDGVVTSRSTDIGALISAGTSNNGPALFTVANTRKLRVYVQVPQSYMPSIKLGGEAELSVPEHAGRKFKATVQSAAGTINARSGGGLVQLVVDNADGSLLAGGYADVKLLLPANANGVAIPASSLIFAREGLQVATLGPDSKVLMKPIHIDRDMGKSVEVTGLQAHDRVIDNPPESLASGDRVQLAAEKKTDVANKS